MSRRDSAGSRPSRVLLFAFIYVILLFHISGYVGNQMATTTFSVTLAIVEEGRLEIDNYIEGARELAYHEGHFYSGMPPGQSFIALPLYVVLRPAISVAAEAITPHLQDIEEAASYGLHHEFGVRRLLLLMSFSILLSLPTAAAVCCMVVSIAERLGERVGVLSALLLPLCTIWWSYGTDYGPRVMGGFLLLLPIWWVFVRRQEASDRESLVMSIAMGTGIALAPLIRYELIFPAVAIGLWLLFQLKRRYVAWVLVTGIVIAASAMVYHTHCYGAPTRPAYGQKLWPADALPAHLRAQSDSMPRVWYEGEQWLLVDQREFVSFTPRTVAQGLWADREALLRFSPFLLLVPVGAFLMLSRKQTRGPAVLLSILILLSLLILALMPHPGFRGSIGPRYLLWALPFIVLLTIPVWSRLPHAFRVLLFAASFAPSYLAAMLGSHAYGAWSFGQLAEFGLTNYTLSRAQQAGLVSPTISTTVVLVFWAIIATVFLRPGSRWCILPTVPKKQESQEMPGGV